MSFQILSISGSISPEAYILLDKGDTEVEAFTNGIISIGSVYLERELNKVFSDIGGKSKVIFSSMLSSSIEDACRIAEKATKKWLEESYGLQLSVECLYEPYQGYPLIGSLEIILDTAAPTEPVYQH